MQLYLVIVVMFKFSGFPVDLAPVVQKVDSVIHLINLYPLDKCKGIQLHHPLDGDLSGV